MISLRLLSFLGSLVTVSSIFVCLKAHNEINVEDFRASDEVAAQAIEMFQSLNIDLEL